MINYYIFKIYQRSNANYQRSNANYQEKLNLKKKIKKNEPYDFIKENFYILFN